MFIVHCFVSFTFSALELFLLWWGLFQNNKQIYFSPTLDLSFFLFFFLLSFFSLFFLSALGLPWELRVRWLCYWQEVRCIFSSRWWNSKPKLRDERIMYRWIVIGKVVESNNSVRARIRSGRSSIVYRNVNRNCRNGRNRYRAHSRR